MQPSILFLGTAGDVNVYGKQFRASGGIVIRVEGYQFMVDPGPGALVRAAQYGINIRENTATLASGSDILKCNDLNAVIASMTLEGFDRQGVLIGPAGVINGDEGEKPIVSNRQKAQVERILTVGPEKKIGIESIEIHTLRTLSKGSSCIGFKFYTSKFILSYSSDTGYSQDIARQYEKSDILILNVQNPFSEKSEFLLNSEDAAKIIAKVKPRLAVLTGFGMKMLNSDPMYESREIQKSTGIQVIAAKDGLEVNPVSYSALLRQKTLNLYS